MTRRRAPLGAGGSMTRTRTLESLVAALFGAVVPSGVTLAQAADPAGDHLSPWASALWILAAVAVLVSLLRLVFGRDPRDDSRRQQRT
jgi:hypothetical protein